MLSSCDVISFHLCLAWFQAGAEGRSPLVLEQMYIYPIKSCAGMRVSRWPLSSTGLLFDREWALMDSNGRALRLKVAPRMCLIAPSVRLETQELVVSAPGMPDLTLPLTLAPPEDQSSCSVKVCGEACGGLAYEASVSRWFSEFLGMPCTLVRSSPYAEKRAARGSDGDGDATRRIAFSNEAQLLLVCLASVEHLNGLIAHRLELEERYEIRYEGQRSEAYVTVENFRPNLVIGGGVAHQEDLWRALEVGDLGLRVTGPCSRCSMVNIDHRDGSNKEVLTTLATYRRDKSNIYFGQFLSIEEFGEMDAGWLQVGSVVRPRTAGDCLNGD
jgi:molybdenum cofactor sulfurtransferase